MSIQTHNNIQTFLRSVSNLTNGILRVWKVSIDPVDDHLYRISLSPGPLASSQTNFTWRSADFFFNIWSAWHTAANTDTDTHALCILEYSLVSVWVQRQWVIFALHAHAHTHTHPQTVTGLSQNVMVTMCEWGNYTVIHDDNALRLIWLSLQTISSQLSCWSKPFLHLFQTQTSSH